MPTSVPVGLSRERRRLRARKGVAVRLGRHDEAAEIDAEIRTARLADYIRRTVDTAPPLTSEQRDRLALLLRSGAPPGRAESSQRAAEAHAPTQAAGGSTSAEATGQSTPAGVTHV